MDKMLKILEQLSNGVTADGGTLSANTNFGLTLVVAGQVISGTTTTAKKYVSTFGNHFASAMVDIGLGGDEAIDFASKVETTTAALTDGFLHLENVSIWHGSHEIKSGDMIWRVRIDDISAYTLGTPTKS